MQEIPRTVQFWDENAPWYRLWLEHNPYHDRIKEVLAERVRPGWRILDIGGGGGVLSIPLALMACQTIVLEPSHAMRRLLNNEARRNGLGELVIDNRRWEDALPEEYDSFDLLIASNSLHVLSISFDDALRRIMDARPANIFVVTEIFNPCLSSLLQSNGYDVALYESYTTESSFAYHSVDEAIAHSTFRKRLAGASLAPTGPTMPLTYSDGHYRLRDTALVHLFWLEKTPTGTHISGGSSCTVSSF
jgi:ubiquinone/menaquinone biosynthesis C-methylase UbiE